MPLFSIVVTCYNQRTLIRAAVDSALAQTWQDREIIVVDDGSDDGSVRHLRAYGDTIACIELASNQGAAAARNRGAAEARGDYLVFLDGDDILMPWALDVYARVAVESPSLILGSLQYVAGEHVGIEIGNAESGSVAFVVDYADYFTKDRVFRATASAMVVERATFHAVGGWAPDLFHGDDQDLLFRLGCAKGATHVLSPPTTAYRRHANNATRRADRLVTAYLTLIERERMGHYPGGTARQFERRAVIGGAVFFMVKRALRERLWASGWTLLANGWSFICAAMLRRCLVQSTGRLPVAIVPALERRDELASAGPRS